MTPDNPIFLVVMSWLIGLAMGMVIAGKLVTDKWRGNADLPMCIYSAGRFYKVQHSRDDNPNWPPTTKG